MDPTIEGRASFPPTAWTLLAGIAGGGSGRARAIADVGRRYWTPVYVYLRRKGRTEADAQDLVQSFFVHLLEKDLLTRPDRAKGRFRSWLRAVLEHFLANEARIRGAQKKGRGKKIIALDFEVAEQAVRAGGDLGAGDAFDRAWAHDVLSRAFARLAKEMEAAGKQPVLATLKKRMGLLSSVDGPEANDVAVHRARKRLRALILEEVGDSVKDPSDATEEVAELFRALGGNP